jgi:3-mercaptopropionate dioxygenase
MSAAPPHKLRDFLAEMTRIVAGPDDPIPLARDALAALVAQDDWLDEDYAQPHPEHYQQYLLYCDPLARFSVVSFVWGPGQFTPIHNHQTWGLVGMLRGSEYSRAFTIIDGTAVPGEEELLTPGTVAVIDPNEGDIHQVRNAVADTVSISIHIYGADIGAVRRQIFKPDGSVVEFVSGYANDRLPNVWGRR